MGPILLGLCPQHSEVSTEQAQGKLNQGDNNNNLDQIKAAWLINSFYFVGGAFNE